MKTIDLLLVTLMNIQNSLMLWPNEVARYQPMFTETDLTITRGASLTEGAAASSSAGYIYFLLIIASYQRR